MLQKTPLTYKEVSVFFLANVAMGGHPALTQHLYVPAGKIDTHNIWAALRDRSRHPCLPRPTYVL